uniref:Uncharacterized protein n=1 Tax=Enterococcus faecium TaxID=1352 RepID=A0A7T8QZZ0_ENTFC|nr:hypothetical protein [Enterococcus faecium]QQP61352.1 hypothetical protein [Enterococcus faecium]
MKLVQNNEVKEIKNGFVKNSNKILGKLKKVGSFKKINIILEKLREKIYQKVYKIN